MKVTIYTDGAARGNPDGPGGYGCIIHYVDLQGELHVREFSEGFKKTTNNRMEMLAVIIGLEALTRPCQVTVVSDSRYVTDAFNQHWIDNWQQKNWVKSDKKPALNPDLWGPLLDQTDRHTLRYHWVKGHAENEWNNRCDELAVMESQRFK